MTAGQAGEEADLVRRTLAADKRAFAVLVERHQAAVYRFAERYTGDADEALDIAQEAFASAFVALKRYDPARPFKTWLMRIVVNKCHDWSRRRAVRRFFSGALPIEHAFDVAADIAAPDIAASDAMELARVSAAITRLPAPLREVLILRTIDAMSQAETATILGISEKAVENKLRRARQQVLAMLPN